MNDVDVFSPEWRAVMKIAETNMAMATDAVTADGMDHSKTQFWRGYLAAWRVLVQLDKERKVKKTVDEPLTDE